ncbi:MAG TPA: transglycosylase SLT domain-containing protein [Myxococcaceae bacterium]
MIQVAHVSGSRKGESFSSPGPLIRVGRSAGCDLRYDADREPRVSYHHAELVLDGGRWFVVDTDSEHGVLVNGKKVQRQPLRPGDRIAFGQGGPEVRVEAADAHEAEAESGPGGLSAMREEAYRSITSTRGVADEEDDLARVSSQDEEAGEQEEEEEEEAPAPPPKHRGNGRAKGTSATKLAEEVAVRVAEQRALSGGKSSGQTTFIVADAIEAANAMERQRTRRRWVRIVAAVLAGGALITSGMGVVIFRQRRQLDALVNEKRDIDQEIAAVEAQMANETDPDKLLALEAQLQSLTGRAKGKLDELGEQAKSSDRAKEVLARQDQGDELDREMRAVLRKFGADTYAVPPLFKERVRWHIDWLVTRKNWPQSQERWKRYWPSIRKSFQTNGVPEELGYIAYVESQFDAEAYNDKAGARGMWQFIVPTARSYGLRVDANVDERIKPEKAADAAAKYLSALLIEFGEQSFMLVLASYNKGEDGVRRALHKVAKEPGGYKKRDFWHLYRMKLLPDETREYVPAVMAAAIVFGNPLHYGGPSLPADAQ